MKRTATIIGSMCFILVLNVPASGETKNFSGKWVLNTEKSDSEPRVTPVGRTAGPKMQTGRTPNPHPPLPQTHANIPPGAKIPTTATVAGKTGNGVGRVYGGATFDGNTPVATDVPLTITQTGNQMRIVNALRVNGSNVPNTEDYALDGEKYEETIQGNSDTELKRETKASLKKNKIKIEVVTSNSKGRLFRTTREFSLSKDGKRLTVELSSQSQYFLSSQKIVYDKEE